MADWTLEVDVVTKNLQDAIGRQNIGGGSTQTNQGDTENVIAGGFSKGLKFAGLIGILSSLKVVTDSIGFILGAISSLISYFVVSFIQTVIPFFQDPVRALLELGVWIVNGIIGAIEFLANAIVPESLQPEGGFDFGRIDTQEVLALYDQAKALLKDTVDSITGASEEFDGVKPAIEGLKTKMDGTVNALGDALDYIVEQARSASRGGGSSSFTSSGTSTFSNLQNYAAKQSLDPTIELQRQSANKILKYL